MFVLMCECLGARSDTNGLGRPPLPSPPLSSLPLPSLPFHPLPSPTPMEYDYDVIPGLVKTLESWLHWKYLSEKCSITLSRSWDSPVKLKNDRNCLIASSRDTPSNSKNFRYSFATVWPNSDLCVCVCVCVCVCKVVSYHIHVILPKLQCSESESTSEITLV